MLIKLSVLASKGYSTGYEKHKVFCPVCFIVSEEHLLRLSETAGGWLCNAIEEWSTCATCSLCMETCTGLSGWHDRRTSNTDGSSIKFSMKSISSSVVGRPLIVISSSPVSIPEWNN